MYLTALKQVEQTIVKCSSTYNDSEANMMLSKYGAIMSTFIVLSESHDTSPIMYCNMSVLSTCVSLVCVSPS